MLALHAAVTRDLTQRGRPLPRMVSYNTAASLPALALANRIYGDASRTDELIAENRAVHPLFMPAAGRALTA
jgi:prophage DNA circulation protein